jgi:hypothetical protein
MFESGGGSVRLAESRAALAIAEPLVPSVTVRRQIGGPWSREWVAFVWC